MSTGTYGPLPSAVAARVRVALVTPALAAQVRALRVAPEQYGYVGDVVFNLIDAERDPHSDAMAILVDDPAEGVQVIGFYRIDQAPTIVSRTRFDNASLGLRAWFLDRGWQGRGLAAPALFACCADLEQRYPGRYLLALNVNCSNVVAIRAYRRAGFVDTGELFFGGSAGPQRLLVRRLRGAGVGESRHGRADD